MRVALTTIGKFHTFDLARHLYRRDMLAGIFTGYPMFKLGQENLPARLIHSFPWLQTLYMSRGRLGLNSARFERELGWLSKETLDTYAALRLPKCDVFLGLSGTGLRTGKTAQSRGAIYICDRASSHIRFQDCILEEEYRRHGLRFNGIDPRIVAKEVEEYRTADLITVPSRFVYRSFLEMGVPEAKLRQSTYGVDLTRFQPCGTPDPDRLDILFVGSASIRKGIPDLLSAFAKVSHPRKSLTLVGTIRSEVAPMIREASASQPITCLGHVPQPRLKEIFSRSHAMVLPSLEEGCAYVLAQAMACGCPAVASTNTGAEDLMTDGVQGFIVPIRSPETIAARLQQLADTPALRSSLSKAAIKKVENISGWDRYGERMIDIMAAAAGGSQG